MRTRIKSIQANGQTKVVKEWKTVWGENMVSVLATSETPKHAKSSVRKTMAFQRSSNDDGANTKDWRKTAFMVMPRRVYKQVYINAK